MKFTATCRMHDPSVGPRRLTQGEYEAAGKPASATFDYGTKMWNVAQRCDFASTDVAELQRHLKSVHDNKKRITVIERGKRVERHLRINCTLTQRPMRPKWRGPVLKDEGKRFEPTGLEPGAEVEWGGRTGQVWSLGHEPKSVWVIPDEPSMQDRTEDGLGVRHELAVLLVAWKANGKLYEHQTSWSSWKAAAA